MIAIGYDEEDPQDNVWSNAAGHISKAQACCEAVPKPYRGTMLIFSRNAKKR